MAFAPISEIDRNNVAGHFIEVEYGHYFNFSKPCDSPFFGYNQKVWVGNAPEQFRWANILKTVVYIVIDEGADGMPIVEKWKIKNQRNYT